MFPVLQKVMGDDDMMDLLSILMKPLCELCFVEKQ